MPFTQQMIVEGADAQALADHIAGWHRSQAGSAPGYLGSRVFAEDGGSRHVIEVDFSSEEEAQRNNDRPETAEWAQKLQQLGSAQPSYRNLQQVYSTYG